MEWKSWTAYYTENRTFNSTDIDWIQLPESGVLIVVVQFEGRRNILEGADWYYLHDGDFGVVLSKSWTGWEPKPTLECQSCIKQGIGTADEEFWRIYQTARDSK